MVGKTSIPVSKLKNGQNDLWLQLPSIKNLIPEIHVILQLEPHLRVKVCEGKDLPSMDIGKNEKKILFFYTLIKVVKVILLLKFLLEKKKKKHK